MKIDEALIPIRHPNRPGVGLEKLKAIIIHYTGNDNPKATDTGNVKYMGRAYIEKQELDPKTNTMKTVFYEADGKTKFRFGSAHCFIDCDSATLGIPFSEITYACGDRPNPFDNGFKGQTFIAKNIFNYRQNNCTVSFEMCNNKDWAKVEDNTIEVIKQFLKERNLRLFHNENGILPSKLEPDQIFIFRHFDVSGKSCPLPLMNRDVWNKFVGRLL